MHFPPPSSRTKTEETTPLASPSPPTRTDKEDEEEPHASLSSDERKPIINNYNNNNQHRRRKAGSNYETASSSSRSSRQKSFRRDVEHAAAETFLLTRLTFTLLQYLGVGYRWISKFLALAFYAMLLMPGFLQVGYYYFFSKQVRRSVVYGDQPRNRLDLYLPENCDGRNPVVAFVTGGAWIIGYKAWGALLGRRLAERDVIVACIDYRNFPQGTISDMVKDVSQGISYVCNNIAEYGGDPNRIYLVGQSAGAHISACALLRQAVKQSSEGENISWSVSQIKAYFGISGGYNMFNLVDHFHGRGLYRSIFLSIMEGMESLKQFSPEVMVQDPSIRNAVSLLPPIFLFHGSDDYSIPSESSETFANTLQRVGAQVKLILYKGKTHTDLFLQLHVVKLVMNEEEIVEEMVMMDVEVDVIGVKRQFHGVLVLGECHSVIFQMGKKEITQDPLRGGKDRVLEDMLSVIQPSDMEHRAKEILAPPIKRLVPEIMLQAARKVSPF